MRRLILALSFAASPAVADTLILPSDYLTDEERGSFRICRAAILIEDGAPDDEKTLLPPAVISAMREQITFIMSETIFNVPAISFEDGSKRIDFTEQFVIDFGKTIGTEMPRLDTAAARAPILINCQAPIWQIMKQNIDVLMQWRMRAMGLDRPFPHDEGPAMRAAPAD